MPTEIKISELPAASSANGTMEFEINDSGTSKKVTGSQLKTFIATDATLITVDNLSLDGNTIASTNSNGNIVLAPNGTGDVQVDADTLRVGDSGTDAIIQSNGNADLILKTGNSTTGSVTLADGANGNLTLALDGTGQVVVNAGTVGTPIVTATGDTNTGIYFPAADTVAIAAGGSVAASFNSHQFMGMRNRIINGDMRIDQRNAGAAVTANDSYAVDRFLNQNDTDGAFSAQQDSSAPSGFINSLKFTTTTADASLSATQRCAIQHRIEGTNVSDLAWGTANAKTVTLSFWVRSSLTGTFGGALGNSAANRSYPFTYSISSADTWEYKTVTIAGDTTGTWLTTTGIGLRVYFALGMGSTYSGTAGAWAASDLRSATGAVSVIGTLNATFYITGVQLEAGSVATPFERRPYGTELALCQRYLPAYTGGVEMLGYWDGTNEAKIVAPFLVESRVAPTGVTSSGSFNIHAPGSGNPAATAINFSRATTTAGRLSCTVSSGGLSSSAAAALNSAAGKILFTGCEL